MRQQSYSYRSIIRNTFMLGGAQICQALVGLIRGKLIAALLGTEGMGINSLLNSSSAMIQQTTSCGIGMAGSRQLSDTLHNRPDQSTAVAAATRSIALRGAIAGAVICAALSVPLSVLSFGSHDRWAWFAALGAAVGFTTLTAGETAILQSHGRMREIARGSVAASALSLIPAAILFVTMHLQGIVPALVILSMLLFLTMRRYACRIVPPGEKGEADLYRRVTKRIIRSGVTLTLSMSATAICAYLLNVAIRYFGSTDTVGLYQAANSISMQYAAVIFAALATDFFPRLSAVAHDNPAISMTVNRQTKIVSDITAPIGALIILTAPMLVELLLSEEFRASVRLLRWLGIGIYLKALSYPMGYITFVKDNRKVFLMLEGVLANTVDLGSIIGCYLLFGLDGLGIGVCIGNILTIGAYYIVNRRLYGYRITTGDFIVTSIRLLAVGGVCAASFIADPAVSYSVMTALSLVIIAQSIYSLRRRYIGQ